MIGSLIAIIQYTVVSDGQLKIFLMEQERQEVENNVLSNVSYRLRDQKMFEGFPLCPVLVAG